MYRSLAIDLRKMERAYRRFDDLLFNDQIIPEIAPSWASFTARETHLNSVEIKEFFKVLGSAYPAIDFKGAEKRTINGLRNDIRQRQSRYTPK